MQAVDSQEKLCSMKLVILSLMIVVLVVVKYVSTFEAMERGMRYQIAFVTNWEDGTSDRAEFLRF